MIRTALTLSALLLAAPAWAREPAPAAEHAHGAHAAQDRFVLLEGGRNFRDVGGYRTRDGRTVKPGILYRSGSLGSLTAKGQADLGHLGIAEIVDLRSTEERSHDTYDLAAAFGERYWFRDYTQAGSGGQNPFADPGKLTQADTRAIMADAYRRIPLQLAPSYRALFAELVAGKQPLVVNCTAGKDRTGIATALVLTALGVPYADVRKDFLLSNGAPGMNTLAASISPGLAKLPADVVAPLIGVEGVYLDSAFAQLKQQYGSVEGYMEKELGVGPKEVAALRRRMLK